MQCNKIFLSVHFTILQHIRHYFKFFPHCDIVLSLWQVTHPVVSHISIVLPAFVVLVLKPWISVLISPGSEAPTMMMTIMYFRICQHPYFTFVISDEWCKAFRLYYVTRGDVEVLLVSSTQQQKWTNTSWMLSFWVKF